MGDDVRAAVPAAQPAGLAEQGENGFLVLDGLVKRFGSTTVVDGLSLSVARGELVCLLGPSGCGKTTTLQMVGGFLRPDAGRVLVDGADVTRMPPEERPVSTVFQSYALFPHLDVLDNVAYGLKFRGLRKREARERALEMLGRVGMADRAGARVDEISGGQQQRVALARSLVLEPKVLLLDEPLSNLDAALRVRMRAEIKQIQRAFGVTMVFVTHDQEEAMAVGDRIAIMHGGRLLQVGAPEEVYARPADEYCARFFGPVNELEEPGGEVLRFRPDDVRVREDGRGAVRGRVEACAFLGARRECTVLVEGADPPRRVTIRCDRATALREGDEVSFDVEERLEW